MLLAHCMRSKLTRAALITAFSITALFKPAAADVPQKVNSAPISKSSAESPNNANNAINANTIDGVIVTVADEPLLLSELQRAIFQASQHTTRLSPSGQLLGGRLSSADAELVLEQIINQKILSLRVRELGLNLSEDELDSELRGFLQGQNISEDKFEELLRAEGETKEGHREEFRRQVETQRFIGRVIRPLVSVTDDQVRGFYMQQNSDKDQSQRVKLRSLMIEIPAGLSNEELQVKKKNIESIRRDIDNGRPFVELVQIYSEAKDAIKTKGLLPSKPLSELPEKLRSKLKGKSAPTVIGPLELGLSVFFFEFLGTELGDEKEFEKQKSTYEAKLQDIKFRERLEEYIRSERLKVKVNRHRFVFSK